MAEEHLSEWLRTIALKPIHIDCVTTVMLKILDRKCKMVEAEKVVMAQLYDLVKGRQGELMGHEMHELIARSRGNIDDEQRMQIYEKRLLAETMISRPVMKSFKAMIRKQGLFEVAQAA